MIVLIFAKIWVKILWLFCDITQLLRLVLAQFDPKTSPNPCRAYCQLQNLGEQTRYKRDLVLDPIGFSIDLAVAHSLSRGRRRWDGAKSGMTAGRSL